MEVQVDRKMASANGYAKGSAGPKKRKTRFVDEFSREVFEATYRFGTEQDINDRHLAIARDIAAVETPELRDLWTDNFLDLLEDFKFLPGGRITSNAGTGLGGTTYINCFVSGFRGEDQDSMESIMDELRRQALILKSEGGYGFCADVMRPRGAYVNGIGGDSPGAVRLLDMWDMQSGVITSGSGMKKAAGKGKQKIRKGAQMVTMSVYHPDIEEFITAKQTPGRLTKFNMSVLVTDDFMAAVEADQPWHLQFPDIDQARAEYKSHWDGNLSAWKAKGFATKTYKTFASARELWDIITKSTYTRNEPGVLFQDTINRLNNLYYVEHINATNPCGEQVLPVGGSCLLGSLNLTQFVDARANDWDYEKLKHYIPVAVRFLDNVNDRTLVPLKEQEINLQDKRRVGLGILGYGSALMMLKTRYGSDRALELTKSLSEFIMNEAYAASAKLAKEKASFRLYDAKKYLAGEFVKRLSSDVRELIKQNGMRNSHLLSIQPTGNSSVLANNVSGGLEPLFMTDYVRTVIQTYPPDGLSLPLNINWDERTYDSATKWDWIKEGDESMLATTFNDAVYKFDRSRGLLRESQVRDYAVRFHMEQGTWEPEADWAATAFNLQIEDHVKTMGVLAQNIDSAMSKTVNIPADYPFEAFKDLYTQVYKTGVIKGCTSYRAGTMATVLATTSSVNATETRGVPRTKAVERPKELDCDVHQITSQKQKWCVLVGLLDNDPFEVFALKQGTLHMPTNLTKGRLIKEGTGHYTLKTPDGWVLNNLADLFESDEQEALTRMISTALRHGADIGFIVAQLYKAEGNITSFAKAIGRTLKGYATEIAGLTCSACGSKQVKMQEGCFVCADCGSSKCE